MSCGRGAVINSLSAAYLLFEVRNMTAHMKKPEWLKQRVCNDETYTAVKNMMKRLQLHTVCENADCPNIGECFGHKTATFLILGGVCTRACRYCAVTKGKPLPPDRDEPGKLAAAVEMLGLKHVVITSVARDDLADGGAFQFSECIQAVRRYSSKTTTEVLVPDFMGKRSSLDLVLRSRPTVFNDNIEAVRRRFSDVRTIGSYDLSLEVLKYAANHAVRPLIKSGIMVGFGETPADLEEAFRDLKAAGADIITIGQYLRPSEEHVPVAEYITPEKFELYKNMAEAAGISHVVSGPLVRSSYKAGIAVDDYYKAREGTSADFG